MIFEQVRVGQHGRPFVIRKIETMRDGRVVRPLLRRTGLDELPQIVNVLRGEMAVFGPRPEVPELDERYCREVPLWRERHAVKPGLLGMAQVLGVVRGPDRFSPEAKARQAELDARWSRAGFAGRAGLALLTVALLPYAVVRGQRS